MDGQTPTPPNTVQPMQPTSPKRGLFGVLFAIIVLILILGILNYFNILRLSEIFPNQLGWLPYRPYQQQSQQPASPAGGLNNVTIPPSEQAKQTLINFLPTILSPSLLPKSSSEVKLTEDKKIKDNFDALWVTKEGVAGVNFDISSGSKKITSLEFRFQKIQPTSPSAELAQSTATELFYVNPKGTWFCAQIATGTSYCENFWEEGEAKRGLGFQINSTISGKTARSIFSFCEHTKDSNLYSWKSCRSEFAKSGVQ